MVPFILCGICIRQMLCLCSRRVSIHWAIFYYIICVCVCVWQDENTRALVFYLEHAKNARLEFPVAIDQYGNTKMLRYFMIYHNFFSFVSLAVFCVCVCMC